jgi:hypothetical protein
VIRDNVVDFLRVLDELNPTPEKLKEKIDAVKNDDCSGWTLLQLVTKKGLHEYMEKLLQGDLLFLYRKHTV